MTESEARSKIKWRIEVAREITGNGVDGKAFEDLEIAIQALKEIREYRELGSVEEISNLIKFLSFDDDTSILEDLRMLVEYYAIGTVEEFKALKEKNEPKKPIERTRFDITVFDCPTCNAGLYRGQRFCDECGQSILDDYD